MSYLQNLRLRLIKLPQKTINLKNQVCSISISDATNSLESGALLHQAYSNGLRFFIYLYTQLLVLMMEFDSGASVAVSSKVLF